MEKYRYHEIKRQGKGFKAIPDTRVFFHLWRDGEIDVPCSFGIHGSIERAKGKIDCVMEEIDEMKIVVILELNYCE